MDRRHLTGRVWLTAPRARALAAPVWVLSLFLALAMGARMAAPALTDPRHRIAPTDFSAFWAAAHLAASGHPRDAYDPRAVQATECTQAVCDQEAPSPRPYLYPPVFLLACLPFGALPLGVALPAFVATGFVLLAVPLRRLAGEGWTLPILLSPGALLNVVTGQAGCFTAAAFAGGALLLGTRPILAGACLGCLVFKPQLAVGVPVVLLAARRWRALAGCAAVALGICALSGVVFGPATWLAFLDRSRWAGAMLRNEAVWPRLASVYGAARLLRAGVPLAAGAQLVTGLLALGWLAWLARRRPGDGGAVAALAPAALLGTPYLWDYDLVCLSVPAAWLAGRAIVTGWRPWERLALCGAYLLPVLARAANLGLGLPVAPCVAAAMLALVARRIPAAAEARA